MIKKKGFTLIETIIYIALLSIILGGTILITYSILEGEGRVNTKDTLEEEGNFVIHKINWALSGSTFSSFSGYPPTLTLIKQGEQIDFRLNAGKVEMRTDSGMYIPLTTDNVIISSLSFHYITSSGSGPSGIEASTTINSLVFETKRYVRK